MHKNRKSLLPLVAIGLVVIIGVAGLGLRHSPSPSSKRRERSTTP